MYHDVSIPVCCSIQVCPLQCQVGTLRLQTSFPKKRVSCCAEPRSFPLEYGEQRSGGQQRFDGRTTTLWACQSLRRSIVGSKVELVCSLLYRVLFSQMNKLHSCWMIRWARETCFSDLEEIEIPSDIWRRVVDFATAPAGHCYEFWSACDACCRVSNTCSPLG